MQRRRNISAPFEAMSKSINSRPAPEPEVVEPVSTGPTTGRRTWADRARQPLVLRVPRGYAIIAAVAAVGLLVLAYQVGNSRGHKDALAAQQQEEERPYRHISVAGARGEGASPAEGPNAASGDSLAAKFPDRRQAGLNYIMLARYFEADAYRLATFLTDQGLEVTVVPDNNRWFHVVDLRGFEAGELSSQAFKDHEARLLQLGRIWKERHRGPSNLTDRWPKKYNPAN